MSDPDKSLVEESIVISEADLREESAQAEVESQEAGGELPHQKQSSLAAVAQSVIAKFLIVGVNASTGILSARTLQPSGRGELAAMILWPVFLGSALTLGIPSALTFQMRHHRERQGRLVGAAMLIALLTSFLGILLGFFFLPHWIHQYPPETILYARLFLLSCPLTSFVLVGRAALESDGNFSASNKLLLASPALTLCWLIVLWLTHTITPVRAAFAYVPAGIFPVAWMLHLLWSRFSPNLRRFQDSAKLLFSYGLRSYGIDLCGAMALYVDQALVVRVLPPATMGVYVVALSLSRMLNAFHTSVVMVLFPKAVNRTPQEVLEMTGRATRMSTLMTTLAGLGIMLLGPQVLTLLYGRDYRGALGVLNILVVEVVLSGATLVLSQAFMALGRPGVITMGQVLGLLLSIPLVNILTVRFGIVGTGCALLLSTIARLFFVLISFPIFLKLPVPAVLPRISDLRSLYQLFMKRIRPRTA